MLPNSYAAEVPFPLVGEGAVLRFRTIDLARLRGKYGAPVTAKPEYDEKGNRVDFFWSILLSGVDEQDPIVVIDLLKHGLKKPGGKEPMQVDFDDLPFALDATREPLADALLLARWGKTAAVLGAEIAEAQRKLAEAAEEAMDPLKGLVTGLTNSSESSVSVTEPASDPTNPGN